MILVGAGPGDPGLLTLRGAAALRDADVVVFDALAPSELLELAPAGAQRIDVGKRGHDAPTLSQQDTNRLLVELARSGKRVVRLKGGDPFVFGRGGEEASACAEAGVDFEVVPGVSAALAVPAYAGIPVTDRRHAASFTVVTGHKDPAQSAAQVRWDALAAGAETLVILMGLRGLGATVAKLLQHGRAPDTPAAAISWGTTPRQRVVEAPLAELPARVGQAALPAPVTVVVGDVVRLRASLAWYERLPLFGLRVLVTRAEEQAGELAEALREAGAEPVLLPMIRIAPPQDLGPLDAALDRVAAYDAVLFTSANAVRAFAERAARRGVSLVGLRARVLCVGPATAAAALAAGLPGPTQPRARFDAEGLLGEILEQLAPRGLRFLLPRAEAGRELLPQALREAGAIVDVVAAYRTLAAEFDAAALREQLVQGALDALTFTSPSTVRRLLAALDPASRAALGRCLVAAIGPLTAQALREGGVEPDVVAERAVADALVAALETARRAAGSGGAR